MYKRYVFFAFAIGASVGAGFALLYAPQSGAATRKKLKRSAEDASDYLEDTAGYLKEQAERISKEVPEASPASPDQRQRRRRPGQRHRNRSHQVRPETSLAPNLGAPSYSRSHREKGGVSFAAANERPIFAYLCPSPRAKRGPACLCSLCRSSLASLAFPLLPLSVPFCLFQSKEGPASTRAIAPTALAPFPFLFAVSLLFPPRNSHSGHSISRNLHSPPRKHPQKHQQIRVSSPRTT